MDSDDKPRKLPKKFRASLDPTDESGSALLRLNDEVQKELGSVVNSPFATGTPLQTQMQKALVTIDAYSHSDNHNKGSIELLAEAYATVGQYDTAAELAEGHKKAEYQRYRDALDAEPCGHDDLFVKQYIFSLKDNKEMPLLECTECGQWVVMPLTPELQARKSARDQHKGMTRGMTIAQAREYHLHRIGKG